MSTRASWWRALAGRLADERATAAVEFALILPVFCVLLAGTIDFGGAVYTKFRLDAAVSAASNYVLVNAANVSSSAGRSLANSVVSILAASNTGATTTGTVIINNGPQTSVSPSGTSDSGTPSNADSCYCPSVSNGAMTWGGVMTCGGVCSGGGVAGKFISIVAQQTYTPSFSNYGIVENNTITAQAVVQAQ